VKALSKIDFQTPMHSFQDVPAFKIVLLGDSGVGKTSIVQYFERQTFESTNESTVGASFMSREMRTSYGRINLHIWDTAGQERYRSLVPTYARGACAALVVFDLSAADTFQSIDRWIHEFKDIGCDGCFSYLVGNKADLTATVSDTEASNWASDASVTFFAVSAKTGAGIQDMFQAIAEEIAAKQPPSVQQFSGQPPPEIPPVKKSGCCSGRSGNV
jgi:small GTP-binding protein